MPFKRKSTASRLRSTSPDDFVAFESLSDVQPLEVEWLWKPFIPFGMLTILEGDPGLGKSFVMMDLAARLSVGRPLPTGQRLIRGKTLYMNGEDDAAYTIRPRIDSLGGDPSLIRYMKEYFSFDEDGLAVLEKEIREIKPDLVIIDPLFSFIPSNVDMARGNEVRALLRRLSDLAAILPCAMVMMRHLKKGKSENPLYSGSGVIDYAAVVRSVIRVFQHPEDDEIRVMAHLKHNISKGGKSWEFRIVENEGDKLAIVDWVGESDLTVHNAGSGSHEEGRMKQSDLAKEFLINALANGPVPQKLLLSEADLQNISARTLDRAKLDLKVESKKIGSGWVWKLPNSVKK